ncbi:MAG TPA: tetratricopeptide repeat protein [Roseiflexaceae bacterium]|nr:tetratricopeptide repeat protein [Roseiflexaceae bacterium]
MSDPQIQDAAALLCELLERRMPDLRWLYGPHSRPELLPERPHASPAKSRHRLVGHVLAAAQLLTLDVHETDRLLAAYGQPSLEQLRQRRDPLLNAILAIWPAPADTPVLDTAPDAGAPAPSYAGLRGAVAHTLARLGVVVRTNLPIEDDVLDSPVGTSGALYDERLPRLMQVFSLARQLAAAPEYVIRLRLAWYYIDLADRAQQLLLAGGKAAGAGLALFDRERPNLDAARAWLQQQAWRGPNTDVDALLVADADATANLADLHAALETEQIPRLEQALAAARRRADRDAQTRLQGWLGSAYATLGQPHRAIDLYEQTLENARALGDSHWEGVALASLGNIHKALGDAQRALDFHEQHLAQARAANDRRGQTTAFGNLGDIYAGLADAPRALDAYGQQLELARADGDRRAEGAALGKLGAVYAATGEARRAVGLYEQSLELSRSLGDRAGEGQLLASLGAAWMQLGDRQRAIDFHEQALAVAQALGNRRAEVATLGSLGSLYGRQGDTQRAIDSYQQVLTIARETGERQDEASASWNIGFALARRGDAAQAIPYLEQGLAYYRTVGHPRAAGMAATVAHVRRHGVLPEASLPPEPASRAPIPPTPPLDLPEAVREAVERRDDTALNAALADMPPEQARAITAWLEQAGLVGRGPGMEQILRDFAPLLRAAASAAGGNTERRAEVEAMLPRLEQAGWQLTAPLRRLWAGERDAAALTAGIDENTAALVRNILDLLERGDETVEPPPEPPAAPPEREQAPVAVASVASVTSGELNLAALLAQLPEAVRTALETQDQRGLQNALDGLTDAERAHAERLLPEVQRLILEQIRRINPQEIIDTLPQGVRAALVGGPQALEQALAELPPEQQRATALALAQLRAVLITTDRVQPEEGGPAAPASDLDALLDALPEAVLVALENQDQPGMLAALDALPRGEGERADKTLIAIYEHLTTGLAGRDVQEIIDTLPALVRSALMESVEQVQAALMQLPRPERRAAALALVQIQAMFAAQNRSLFGDEEPEGEADDFEDSEYDEGGGYGTEEEDGEDAEYDPDFAPDIPAGSFSQTPDEAVQRFLPVLGDIALAALGSAEARAMAEEALEQMERDGWRITDATRRIWAGERDAAALTAGLDALDRSLVRQVLDLIAAGPEGVAVARSLQLADLRRQADQTAAQVLEGGDAADRAVLAQAFITAAEAAERQSSAPWRDFAAHLRGLAADLMRNA